MPVSRSAGRAAESPRYLRVPRPPAWRLPRRALACPELNPRQLLARCLEDRADDEAWWAFVQRHGARLRRYLWSALFHWQMATCVVDLDDWEQEVYCRLLSYRRKTAFRCNRSMWLFLHEVVASVVVDGWRYRHRLKRRSLSLFEWRYVGCRKSRARRRPLRRPARRARRRRSRKSR